MNKKLRAVLLSLPIAATALTGQTVITDSLVYTGAMQTYTVPCGVTTLHIECYGAQGGSGSVGGNSAPGGLGGYGAMTSGDLAVTPGQVLNIFVGGAGATPTAGFNGGGSGGTQNAGGGGGATDIRYPTTAVADRLIVAGGGGGGGRGGCETGTVAGGVGGVGGGNGANGLDAPTPGGVAGGGAGGVGPNGGAAGIGCGGFLGQPGATTGSEIGGNGGAGQACCCFSFASVPGGGGGGGGMVGGGGGGGGSAGTTGCSGNDKGAGGGGAGGSNYTGGVTSGASANGVRGNNGVVKIMHGDGLPPAPASITGSADMCEGTNGNYSVPVFAGATSYNWSCTGGLTVSSGQGTNAAVINAGTSSGTIIVSVTDACGTGQSTTIPVAVHPTPTVTANATQSVLCAGNSTILTGGGSGGTYVWTGGVTDGVSFIPVSTTTYTVTCTSAFGCMNTASTTVTVNPLPNVTASSTASTVCAGTSVTLTGGGATSYIWSGGVTDGVGFVPAITATYTVTGTDGNNCSNTATTTVVVNPLPNVSTNTSAIAVCAGDSVILFGMGASTYAWTGGITDGVGFIPNTTTTYTVTGTDANGCMNTSMATVTVNPLPTVTGGASSTSVCLSDAAVTLTGSPVNGTWSGPGVSGSSFTPATAGLGASTTTYTFTDANSCTNTATVVITVNACTGIMEAGSTTGISVYPSPNNGNFKIEVAANVGDLNIEITDVEGRVVYSSVDHNVKAGFVKQISLDGQSSGIYMVHMKTNDGQRIEKISVQK
jgi:hypothetical protein